MNITNPCPTGHYCPNGTFDQGVPCPIGSYNPHEGVAKAEDCLACPAGFFCNQTGLDTPSGNCSAGYLCVSGAEHPGPNDGTNGPCSVGHYCEEGAKNATACPPGTLNPQEGAKGLSECRPCTGGHYCDDFGLTQPTGPCDRRYYCPALANITNPTPVDYKCIPGHFCLNATVHPIPCPPGTYQPNELMDACVPCPAGTYCLANTSVPLVCPPYHFCPAGTIDPQICPNGTYTKPTVTGLKTDTQCEQCETGKYCVDGRETGNCAAGFWCKKGNWQPTPFSNETDVAIGEPCPYGYYCPTGTLKPVQCPDNRFIDKAGASHIGDCGYCPAGKICAIGGIPKPCWPGHFCPYNDTIYKCNKTTYLDEYGGKSPMDCKVCPAGYYCYKEGMTNYTVSPCPPGFYCYEATSSPVPCPAGTYKSEAGAENITECNLCPAGYYCPNTNMTVNGTQCDRGMFCPPGSKLQTICQAGYYCNRTKTQQPCPIGFYCEAGSETPTKCPFGHYCPTSYSFDGSLRGAMSPVKCPLGYKMYEGSNRTTFAETCEPCMKGWYGNHPDRRDCYPCRPGVVCKERAISDVPLDNSSTTFGVSVTRSYPCPVGHYCPRNSSEPTPCPIGTANNKQYQGQLSDCIACPKNHFQPYTGRKACYSCGGKATQPKIGQPTCTCNGAGRDFQFSDRDCPCKVGYKVMLGRETDCVKHVYDNCVEGETRTQGGQCYNAAQWETHCINNVCGSVDKYAGVERLIGLCKCVTEDIDDICDLNCRLKQRNTILFHCPENLYPFISIKDANQNTLAEFNISNLGKVINSQDAFGSDTCTKKGASPEPMHLLECSSDGFFGIYQPKTDQLKKLFLANYKGQMKLNLTEGGKHGYVSRRKRSISEHQRFRRAASTLPGSSNAGVANPTVCLQYGERMIWTITKDHYPVYDRNNLYNTNEKFDYGGFRKLIEKKSQLSSSATMFAYRFVDPGAYAFYISSNVNKKMYIRVMAQDAQCTEDGPFFPTTPRYVIQNGLSIDQDILRAPDWVVIVVLLALLIAAFIILILALILFRKYGWNKAMFINPKYRRVTRKYNMEDYSSKGSAVHASKKYNRQVETMQDEDTPLAIAEKTASDEFWDYDKQVDLEAFSSPKLYEILSGQSRAVTRDLSRQKEEAKNMYQKVNNQVDSLKGLWLAKFNLDPVKAGLATPEDVAAYELKLHELERELERRKELGSKYEIVLERLRELQETDEELRLKHQVSFDSLTREAIRHVDQHVERLQRGKVIKTNGEFDMNQHQNVLGRVQLLISKADEEITNEGERVGACGLLGKGTGASLAGPNSEILKRNDLLTNEGSIKAKDMLYEDPITGLIKVKKGVKMFTIDNDIVNVPSNYVLHTQTAKVLPIEVAVAFDPVAYKLVFTVDSMSCETRHSEPLIPFIPINSSTPIKFKQPENRKSLKLGEPMEDPESGLNVPIIGITINPTTGAVIPVGGAHIDPVTRLLTPIEIGAMMEDPDNIESPVPILGITIDSETGKVLPIGGSRQSAKGVVPIIPFDKCIENLSGTTVKVCGAYVRGAHVNPSHGGMQTLYDSISLSCEAKLTHSMGALVDALQKVSNISSGSSLNVRHESSNLKAVIDDLEKARKIMKNCLLHTNLDSERRLEKTHALATTGGCPGMYEHAQTGQLLPILVGTTIRDTATEMDVPILGVRRDKATGKIKPLGGTHEDPEGSGLVPILLGHNAIDPINGKLATISGVRFETKTNTVVPVTVSSSNKKHRKPPLGALSAMEDEIVARKSFWRRQRQRENELTVQEHKLQTEIMYNIQSLKIDQIEGALNAFEEKAHDLAEAWKREQRRRGDAHNEISAVIPPNIVAVLTLNDEEEQKSEEEHHNSHKKYTETIKKLCSKLRAEHNKLKAKLSELEGAMNPQAEQTAHSRFEQAVARLQGELKMHLLQKMENLDKKQSAVEYSRQRSEILMNEAKAILNGEILVAGEFDWSSAGIFSDQEGESSNELLPLLKQLLQMLQNGQPFYLSSDLLTTIQGGDLTVYQGNNLHVNGQSSNVISPSTAGQAFGDGSGKSNIVHATHVQRAEQLTGTTSLGPNSSALVGSKDLEEGSGDSKARQMFTKQAYEAAKLENDLKSEEIRKINDTIEEYEKKKKGAMSEVARDLQDKLLKATSESEKERIVADYGRQLQKLTDALEKQKQKQLEKSRRELIEKRKADKKQLHRKHIGRLSFTIRIIVNSL